MKTRRDAPSGRTLQQLFSELAPDRDRPPKAWADRYFNTQSVASAFVLADALREHRFERLANDLSAFARGVERELSLERGVAPGPRRRGTTQPTEAKWRTLKSRIRDAIDDVHQQEEGRAQKIVWWVRYPNRWSPDREAIPAVLAKEGHTTERSDFIYVYPLVGPRKDRLTSVHRSAVYEDGVPLYARIYRGGRKYAER